MRLLLFSIAIVVLHLANEVKSKKMHLAGQRRT